MSVPEFTPELEARLRSAIKLMGYSLLYPEQSESIRLNIAGKQTLTLLSTGGGKTACYVIPGLVRSRITAVVSPLIALQNDQVNALLDLGIPAYLYNSDVGANEKEMISQRIHALKASGQPAFIFVSPESMISDKFLELFGGGLIDFMAIDEVHCVSTWGNSFRPDYQRLNKAYTRLEIGLVGGYTATSTSEIMKDIFRYTALDREVCRVVSSDSIRENLHIEVIDVGKFEGNVKQKAAKKRGRLIRFAKQADGAAIVYCGSRHGCEDLYKNAILRRKLTQLGFTTYVYHAMILPEEKRKAEHGFDNDEKPLVFATNAFGMGIDRADVRLVLHYNNPRNLLGYIQEIGRAGRDGADSNCATFFDESLIEESQRRRKFYLPSIAFVEATHERLVRTFFKRKPGPSRDGFSTSKFMRMLEHTLANQENFKDPDRYINMTRESIALLKQTGYVIEDGDEPFRLLKINPGNKRHSRLVKLTEMVERSEVAQLRVIADFFTADTPSQELAWKLLG